MAKLIMIVPLMDLKGDVARVREAVLAGAAGRRRKAECRAKNDDRRIPRVHTRERE